jgi:hypothetical protein
MDQGVAIFLRIDAREVCVCRAVRARVEMCVGITCRKEPRELDA